ncbi:unnamed protein product [Cunninghamella echinulata]
MKSNLHLYFILLFLIIQVKGECKKFEKLGTFCDKEGDSCCDTRSARMGYKEDCENGTKCEKDKECQGICKDKVCSAKPCESTPQCPGGLVCNNRYCSPRITKQIGEEYESFLECASAYCNNNVCESISPGPDDCLKYNICKRGEVCCPNGNKYSYVPSS